jgi:hypothetical protein
MNEADRRVDFEDLDVDTWLSIGLLSWATRTRFKASQLRGHVLLSRGT